MKNVRLIVALLGAGCLSSGCGSSGGALGENPTVSGQIEAWSGGSGYTINVVPLTTPTGQTVLATGTIDASGAFSIEFPRPDAIAPYLISPVPTKSTVCTSAPTANPADLKVAPVSLTLKKAGETSQLLVLYSRKPANNTMPGDVSASFLYADRDGDVSGQTKCETTTSSVMGDANLQLRKGWNINISKIVEFNSTPPEFHVVSQSYTGALPAEVKWWATN